MDEIERVREWLRRKNHTVWGRGFDIKSESGVEEAADFIAVQFTELLAFLDGEHDEQDE